MACVLTVVALFGGTEKPHAKLEPEKALVILLTKFWISVLTAHWRKLCLRCVEKDARLHLLRRKIYMCSRQKIHMRFLGRDLRLRV